AAWIRVVAVAVLLAAFGSAVVLVTAAVLVAIVPSGTPALTRATIRKVAELPAGSVTAVSGTVGPPPLSGDGGADVCIWETNVVPSGSMSVRVTFWASLGPAFVRLIV